MTQGDPLGGRGLNVPQPRFGVRRSPDFDSTARLHDVDGCWDDVLHLRAVFASDLRRSRSRSLRTAWRMAALTLGIGAVRRLISSIAAQAAKGNQYTGPDDDGSD